jgi:predicted GNAT superfamily acetyltransferase
MQAKHKRVETLDALRLLAPLVAFNGDGHPARADMAESLARQRVSIEIPGEILDVERSDMGLAREWREATRWAFTHALGAGFYVAEFCRSIRGQQGPGAYLLERGVISDAVM